MKHANISIFIPHNGCPCKCSFCNQSRITGQAYQPTAENVRACVAAGTKNLGERAQNCEIAFFGGSFTAIDRAYMLELLQEAQNEVECRGLLGIRISTRPDCITPEILQILKKYGVTAIELGAQSMNNRVLTLNQRGHTAESVSVASRLIHEQGFELGLQIMTGLYGSNAQIDYCSAVELTKLSPNTVRIYPTIVFENTELCNLYRSGAYVPQSLEEAVLQCTRMIELFREHQIKILRVGLHSTEEIAQNRVAGPYHPAFMELCLGSLFVKRLLPLLRGQEHSTVAVQVNPRMLSIALGQKKENLKKLADYGYFVTITPNPHVADFEIIYE